MAVSYRKQGEGVALLCDPFGGLIEVKTVTCGHCQQIIHVSPFGDATGDVKLPEGSEHTLVSTVKREAPSVCHRCWSLVCARCHADGRCTPFVAMWEAMEAKHSFLRSAGME
jgi:hypothetical protein